MRSVATLGATATLAVGCLIEFPLPEATESSTTSSELTGTQATDSASTSTVDDVPTQDVPTQDVRPWFRTAAIVDRNPNATPSASETARFDLLVATPSQRMTWAESSSDSWTNLRTLNPDMRLFISVENPGNYVPNEDLGHGWDWIVANHGIGSEDRWAAAGVDYPLAYLHRGSEAAMTLEPATWRSYWLDSIISGLTDKLGAQALSQIDGVYFLTESGYGYPHAEEWEVEVSEGVFDRDHPSDYHDGTAYDETKYRDHLDLFLDEAIDFFAGTDPPLEVAMGFAGLHKDDHWQRLDARAQSVSFAFTSAGLLQKWGGIYNVTNFETKFATASSFVSIGFINGNEGSGADIPGDGLEKMDALATTVPGEGATQMTGWEALWFALCGHLAALDPTRDDRFFYFSLWGDDEFHWFPEYDPANLHLGDPVGPAFKSDGATLREYEDGWVAVNGTTGDLTSIAVPSGRARVITHDSLLAPETSPLVTTFDLPLHRGVVLLRDGATLGR